MRGTHWDVCVCVCVYGKRKRCKALQYDHGQVRSWEEGRHRADLGMHTATGAVPDQLQTDLAMVCWWRPTP